MRPHLLLGHPTHELLLYGWISRTKPVVHVLTDGSAYASVPRIGSTAELLITLGARPGSIFGALTDREAYAMLLERDAPLLLSLVERLAAEIGPSTPMIVTDAVEGYNPVHDLCRMIAGAAIAMAGAGVSQYEYPVVNHPQSDAASIVVDLDDAEYAAKMEQARQKTALVPEIVALWSRHGEQAYRRESFVSVEDWTAMDDPAAPLYEQYGADRVAAHRYECVIRRNEHMLPLRDALRESVAGRPCAF